MNLTVALSVGLTIAFSAPAIQKAIEPHGDILTGLGTKMQFVETVPP